MDAFLQASDHQKVSDDMVRKGERKQKYREEPGRLLMLLIAHACHYDALKREGGRPCVPLVYTMRKVQVCHTRIGSDDSSILFPGASCTHRCPLVYTVRNSTSTWSGWHPAE